MTDSTSVESKPFLPYTSDQDFYKLREELLKEKKLFEDPEFLPQDSSVYYSKEPDQPFEWLRPSQFVEEPLFYENGVSRFDVKQGSLGDCWLVTALTDLTLHKALFDQVVPNDQGFGDNYAGIFHFRFWQYGKWVDVVIDDKLPTLEQDLCFIRSRDIDEFWGALLEKAYAKLHGSYEALKTGKSLEAMVDFTGGVSEIYALKSAVNPQLDTILRKAFERSSLIGCSSGQEGGQVDRDPANGLVTGHSYSVTDMQYVKSTVSEVTEKRLLLRLRNPWGGDVEWKGAWCDESDEWDTVLQQEKDRLDFSTNLDGEFWMAFDDFVESFSRVYICNLTPDALTEEQASDDNKQWNVVTFDGAWVEGVNAGGCVKYAETFPTNPQYFVELTDPDENSEDKTCTVLVELTQKYRRAMKQLGAKNLKISFAIYNLQDPATISKPLTKEFFKRNRSLPGAPPFEATKEVTCRFKLPVGSYCLIPSTYDPNQEEEYSLRVFLENNNTVVFFQKSE